MKATEVILRDHEAARDLITQYQEAGEEEREELEEKLFEALDRHEKMEDEHFYPALHDHMEDNEMFEELEREQTKLKMELAGIKILPVGRGDALKEALLKVLAHAEKEERHILPEAEELLGEEALEELGNEMEPDSAVAASR